MSTKEQLHKRFATERVKAILDKQLNREITGDQAAAYLGISRRRLYQPRTEYEERGSAFTVDYERTKPTRTISASAERHLLHELEIEKTKIIDNPAAPTDRYNYSYVRERPKEKHREAVSVPPIIKHAKAAGYWKGRPPQKIHDRQALTNYTGELIQHDASHHLFAPDGGQKWCPTTSLDDYSRALLYADFWLHETTWQHIVAAQELVTSYGVPLKYDVDQPRVFRYVHSRDKRSPWRQFHTFTDDVDPRWKRVMKDVGVEPVHALSPQAKGKIERPCRWLRDHLARTCVREGVKTIADARVVLKKEVNDYNWKRAHSTTGEIPMRRFEGAIADHTSLWREFKLIPPFASVHDIFCLRTTRIVDAHRQVSINKLKPRVSALLPRQEVELRLSPDLKKGVTEVRFWFKGYCVGQQVVKTQEPPIARYESIRCAVLKFS